MAAFAVRHPSRALKNGRLRGRHESGEENIRLDLSRAPSENVKEVLSNVVCQNGISKNKKLGYLNFFVKLLNKLGPSKNLGYTMEEILCCLKVGLLHEAKEVRAATLRVIRYLLTEQKVLDIIVSLHIDYLIARCLDICLSNEVERIHAMKLIRKIIQLFPHQVPLSMLYPMVAIGRDGSSERDRLRRACLATICELAFVNAQAADRCDAISCILRNILDCYHYPRINESLVVTVLFLLNHPNTRHYIKQNTDLEQLIAPFTDCHFKFSAETNEHGTGDEQETRFKASKMALLTVMRSWPGLIRMCRPTGSGLQSLIGILYIQNNEIRQAIMDVMFDLFRLTTPKLTDSFVEALNSVDPSAMREEWKLLEGFVAEEGRAILPHLAKVRPNLIENHLALILAAWIETGILQALVEVITSTEGHLFIRAVILLGELLHMANTLLPHECTTHSHCLPNLMAVASSFDIPGQHRHRATLAVSYLNRIHTLKKRGPRPCSLFLDQLIQNANTTLQQESFYTQFSQDKLSSDAVKTVFNADDFVSQVIRETHVLSTKEHKSWDWHSISALLKCPDKFKKLDDQTSQRFVRRLLSFFKPTSGQYSSIEQKHPAARKITVACCHFIDFLIETDVEETNKLIVEFLGDINNCLSEMKSERAISDSIFSPTLINNTLSKYYFLFIGRFSATDRGEQCLQRAGIFQSICDVISASTPDVYIKLIVSSMYYARDCSTKVILSKALVSSSENGRLYATKFLRVLLRTKMPMFRSWGMEVLVTQLYDQSRAVAMAALNVIDEACEIQGHIGMSTYGIVWLKEEGLVTEIIRLAEECGVFSVRGTAFYTLGLLASTRQGANILAQYGWESTWRNRSDKWPIVEHHEPVVEDDDDDGGGGGSGGRSSRAGTGLSPETPSDHQNISLSSGGTRSDSEELSSSMATNNLHLGLSGMQSSFERYGSSEERDDQPQQQPKESAPGAVAGGRSSYSRGGFKASGGHGGLGIRSGSMEERGKGGVSSSGSGTKDDSDITLHRVGNISRSSTLPPRSSGFDRSQVGAGRFSTKSKSMHGFVRERGFLSPMNPPPGTAAPAVDRDRDRSPTKSLHIMLFSSSQSERSSIDKVEEENSDSLSECQETDPAGDEEEEEEDEDQQLGAGRNDNDDNNNNNNNNNNNHHNNNNNHHNDHNHNNLNNNNGDASGSSGGGGGGSIGGGGWGGCRPFEIGVYRTRVGSLREPPQSTSDSSRTSKSRADSFNTDSTTSGVSSCGDDSAGLAPPPQPLTAGGSGSGTCSSDPMCRSGGSPTASSVALLATTDSSDSSSAAGHHHHHHHHHHHLQHQSALPDTGGKDYVHPSSQQRKLVNLSRVPSMRRHCGSPPYGIKPCVQLQGLEHVDNPVSYTSTRDAAGLATLRLIRRQRTSSSDVDSDYGLNNLYGEDDAFSRTCSIGSQKSAEAMSFHES
ncbi:rapamycin-insensitive companion of mTOR [Octopus vulgaris]|uniref:Rapamycin-insensitive companion of mTOR n=1 Tax=Octopus vulgaris TaxID=6645 RepID=A0AA36FR71_OCTVU|nr:rapamycin-insensitive companion of mTOR [Octopus vulgaris]